VEDVRGGGGPRFLESRTYRYRGHHVGDVDRRYYRSREEEEEWARDRDPLRRLANWLITEELAEELTFTHLHEEAGAADGGRDDLSGELPVKNDNGSASTHWPQTKAALVQARLQLGRGNSWLQRFGSYPGCANLVY
jgi:hypothetical protein